MSVKSDASPIYVPAAGLVACVDHSTTLELTNSASKDGPKTREKPTTSKDDPPPAHGPARFKCRQRGFNPMREAQPVTDGTQTLALTPSPYASKTWMSPQITISRSRQRAPKTWALGDFLTEATKHLNATLPTLRRRPQRQLMLRAPIDRQTPHALRPASHPRQNAMRESRSFAP